MLQEQLGLFIDEYFKEIDKKHIHSISISIPEHNGNFFIINSASLVFDPTTFTFKPEEPFSLAIYFSFNSNSKKGNSLVNKIVSTECFKDFTIRKDSRNLAYFKDKYLNKTEIIEKIKAIVLSLFPNVNFNDIDIKLNRLDNWMTIEEQNGE